MKRVWFNKPVFYPERIQPVPWLEGGTIDWERRVVVFEHMVVPMENVAGFSREYLAERNEEKSPPRDHQEEAGPEKPRQKRAASKSKGVRRRPKS